MLEREYQAKLIKKLHLLFPGCIVLKNDSGYLQGVPDLIVLYGERWAMLEVKPNADSSRQPNQDFYIEKLNEMSYAAFIHPTNEQDTLRALQQALEPRRNTRIPRRE